MRLGLLALALAAAALLTWVLLSSGTDWLGADDPPGSPGDESPSGARHETDLEGGAPGAPPALVGRPPPALPLARDRCGVHGVVRDARTGQPVAGAPVYAIYRLEDELSGRPIGSTVSADDGSYELRDLEWFVVPIYVVARGNGFIPERGLDPGVDLRAERRWRVGLRRDAWIEHDLHVVPGARAEGVVLLPDGRPAVGAAVDDYLWDWDSHAGFPWEASAGCTTDAAGAFRLDGLPPARGAIFHASLEGYRDVESEAVDLGCGETARVVLRFDTTRDVEVFVLDAASGAGIFGAHVGPVGAKERPYTRDEGKVQLEGVVSSDLRLEVTAPGYASYLSEGDAWDGLIQRADEGVWRAEIRLEPQAYVRGRIVCPEGLRPEACGVLVEVLAVPGHPEFGREADVDAEGRFLVVVPPAGRFVVHLSEEVEYRDYEAPVVEAASDGPEVVLRPRLVATHEFGLSDPPKTWHVTLLGPDGSRIRSASFLRETASGYARYGLGVVDDLPFEDGVVTFAAAPRPVWIAVLEPRTASGTRLGACCIGPFDTQGGERTVRLPAGRSVRGRLVDERGAPVAGAEVFVRAVPPTDLPKGFRWDGLLASAVSDARGRFVANDLGVGAVDLEVRAWPDYLYPPLVRARPGTTDALVAVRSSVSARLRVMLPDGSPVPDCARIRIIDVEGVPWDAMPRYVWRFHEFRTDAAGEVQIDGLDPESAYVLKVEAPWRPPGLLDRKIDGWQPKDTVIRLEQKLLVRGVVRDRAGTPQGGVIVYLRDAGGKDHWDISSWGGEFTFEGVAAGPASLGARFGAWRRPPDDLFRVKAQAGDENVEVLVESERDLRVLFPEGDPGRTQSLCVTLTPRDGAEGDPGPFDEWGSEGEFFFRGLERGASYWLWAGPTDSGRYAYVAVGPDAVEVEAHLVTGQVVRGTLILPSNGNSPGVSISERGIHTRSNVADDGSFELIGVPPGTWTVEAECDIRGGGSRSTSATVSAGGTVELNLE